MSINLTHIKDVKASPQSNAGYETAEQFRAVHQKTLGFETPELETSGLAPKEKPFYISWTDSPLGQIITVCDEAMLYMVEFTSRKNLGRYVNRLRARTQRPILAGRTQITEQIEAELADYFAGQLTHFKTPLNMIGTPFQKSVWTTLCSIPYGQTRSYSELAQMSGNARAIRAAASSNANNTLALIIPCHRVIAKSGGLGDYAGGLAKKQWLLDLEAGNI